MEYEIVARLQGAVFLFFILIRGVMELLLGIDLLVGGEKMERVASYLVIGTVYLSSCMLMLVESSLHEPGHFFVLAEPYLELYGLFLKLLLRQLSVWQLFGRIYLDGQHAVLLIFLLLETSQ